jgi:hypothetical protein
MESRKKAKTAYRIDDTSRYRYNIIAKATVAYLVVYRETVRAPLTAALPLASYR